MDANLRSMIEDHLERALAEDDPSEKDFHIRSALQELDVELLESEA